MNPYTFNPYSYHQPVQPQAQTIQTIAQQQAPQQATRCRTK